MKPVGILSLVGIIVSGTVVLAGQPAAVKEAVPAKGGSDLNARAEAAVLKGLDWLKSIQKDNGAWSDENYPAITGFGLWAFAQSKHPAKAEVCAKAAKFLAGFVQKDGGIYKPPSGLFRRGGLATYNTAVCMTALHAYDKTAHQDVILNARKFVAGSQLEGDSNDSGGFGYNPPSGGKGRGDLSNTAWALQAMRATQDVEDKRQGPKVDVNWEATGKYLEKLQDNDPDDSDNYGAFGYDRGASRGETKDGKKGVVKLRGYGSMTYAGLLSLIYSGVDRKDPRVTSAIQWAGKHWSVEENPGMGTKGLFFYYNIMTRCLSQTGSDKIPADGGKDPIPWKEQMLTKLLNAQKPDGSWVNKDNSFWEGDAAIITGYTVLAMQQMLEMDAAKPAEQKK